MIIKHLKKTKIKESLISYPQQLLICGFFATARAFHKQPQPFRSCNMIAIVGQFRLQAEHSVQRSGSYISNFPSLLGFGIPNGHTSPHMPQPVHKSGFIEIFGRTVGILIEVGFTVTFTTFFISNYIILFILFILFYFKILKKMNPIILVTRPIINKIILILLKIGYSS